MSQEPVAVTATDFEFRVGREVVQGWIAISIENRTRELLWYHGCGSVLDRHGSRGQWQVVWSAICSRVDEVSIRAGEVRETSQFIGATIAEDATGWTTPVDGTYRLRVFIRNAHAALSSDGVATKPFSVATERP